MEADGSIQTKEVYTLNLADTDKSLQNKNIKVYRRRLWMLFLFSFSSMLCGMMYPEYVAVANITSCFYGVSQEAVNWTSLIYMLVYLVLVFPLSSVINYIDLRWTMICTMVCNTAGCAAQFFTLIPSTFNNVMVSAFFGSLSNVLILGIPPALAARWFPSKEVSRACAFGVFGNQLGVAIGFVLNPLLVSSDCSNIELIGAGKLKVAYILTSLNAFILILLIFTFQNSPKFPPSLAEAGKDKESSESHLKLILGMFKNVNFVMVFILNGLIVGSYFAISTLLNDLILRFFPGHEVSVGWLGLLAIVMGLVGSLIAGYILDRTHRFKETALGICIATLLSGILFCSLLYVNKIWVQFITIGIFGFFLTSFIPIGFEYGIEMIYPESENVCASLLNASAMIVGIGLTYLMSYLLTNYGPIYSNVALIISYLMACVIASFITKDYKRSRKCVDEKKKTEINNLDVKELSSQFHFSPEKVF